ncbi:PIN domain-containing protein, partial [Bacillus safensis]|uniref:PIN domain-containing protein n=5 Tax=Bacillus TaxID=1386 RepID=UPI00227EA0F1
MKTYIIFDTNTLYKKNIDFSIFEFNSTYDEFQGKIERNDVIDRFELRVPDITVKELFKQQLQSYNEGIEMMKNSYLKFNQIYEVDLKIDEKFDYEPFLEKKKNQYIARRGIKILSLCREEKFVRIVERALNKEAPFEGKDKKSDKGFKDALIWESILEFAEENDGEFIFYTADKGFKKEKELKMEFKRITGNNIEIYGKDETHQLGLVIEKYSVEKSTRIRLEMLYDNLEEYLEILINELEYKAFQEVELNGILCTVKDFEIIPKIIDLNEVGDGLFKFKLKGKFKAGKTGISYELKTSLYFVVEIENLVSSQIQLIKLDNIDATSMGDDLINIADISFSFSPKNEEEIEEIE